MICYLKKKKLHRGKSIIQVENTEENNKDLRTLPSHIILIDKMVRKEKNKNIILYFKYKIIINL